MFDTFYCIDLFIDQLTVLFILGYNIKSDHSIDKSACELMCYISSYFWHQQLANSQETALEEVSNHGSFMGRELTSEAVAICSYK